MARGNLTGMPRIMLALNKDRSDKAGSHRAIPFTIF